MPVEADYKFCANCVMHSWKQPEDKSSLIKCPGCGMLEYCGEACRIEHWEKVHKNHCQFLADPTKCPQSQHDAESCAICRPATGTGAICRPAAGTGAICLPTSGSGRGKRRMTGRDERNQASFSYECFTKDLHFPPGLSSPHPFPLAGVPNDLLEKSTCVMQNLVHTFKQNPRVAMVCSAELDEMEQFLWRNRRRIWRHRKIFSHPQMLCQLHGQFCLLFSKITQNVTAKVSQGKAGKDATELWKIIEVVDLIRLEIVTYSQLDALKNPVDTMPEQFKDLLKLSLDNKFEFLDVAEDIINSLSTRIIPYEDVIKKLCGGKKRQNCSFCGLKIEVTEHFDMMMMNNYDKKCSSVLFDVVALRKYSCCRQDCFEKASSWRKDKITLNIAVTTACQERKRLFCDFCFQLCPIDKAHRCCNCLAVVYCIKSCHKEDKEKHSREYCFKDERKTKRDRSMRRQRGEKALERLAAITDGINENGLETAFVYEILEAFQLEDDESKKRAGEDPEHKTDIPAAATPTDIPAAATPTSQDDGSKAGTDHTNDRSGSEARF